jgi:hypothetical protein
MSEKRRKDVPDQRESRLSIDEVLLKGFGPAQLDFAFCAYCKMRVIVAPDNEIYNDDADMTFHDCRIPETEKQFAAAVRKLLHIKEVKDEELV